MMEMLRRNPFLAALAVAAAVLAAIVAFELAQGIQRAPVLPQVRPAAPAQAQLLPPLVAANPESAYPETAARPLWVPTRRPSPPAPTVASETLKRDQFVLQGVTIAGDTRIALLRDKASGRIHRAEKGKEVNGLRVVEVQPESVTLGMGDEREVLELRVQKVAGPNVAGTPGGPFAAAAPGAPGAVPGGVPVPAPGSPGAAPVPTPAARPLTTPPQAAAPMTAEELLARRRARRAAQNPPQ